MNISAPLLSWYYRNARSLPWRGEHEPYRIWLSEIMLQQTRAETVRDYYARFLEAFPDVYALAAAPEDRVLKLWEGLGYYARARNLHAAARTVAASGGRFPETAKSLRELPGIGPYAANAIASIAYGEPVPALDGNQARVLSRLLAYEAPLKTPFDLEAQATALLDPIRPGDYNQALMDLSRSLCTPRSPHCDACPLCELCASHAAGSPERYPIKPPRPPRREEHMTIAVVQIGECSIALHRRPSKGLLGGLYEFCTLEGTLDAQATVSALTALGFRTPTVQATLPDSTHIFTHRTWYMTGLLLRAESAPEGYIVTDHPEDYAFPTALHAYTEAALQLCRTEADPE